MLEPAALAARWRSRAAGWALLAAARVLVPAMEWRAEWWRPASVAEPELTQLRLRQPEQSAACLPVAMSAAAAGLVLHPAPLRASVAASACRMQAAGSSP